MQRSKKTCNKTIRHRGDAYAKLTGKPRDVRKRSSDSSGMSSTREPMKQEGGGDWNEPTYRLVK